MITWSLEVIDKRSKGGALWVIGSKKEIGAIIDQTTKLFKVQGNYSNGGRASKYKPAWWISSDKFQQKKGRKPLFLYWQKKNMTK